MTNQSFGIYITLSAARTAYWYPIRHKIQPFQQVCYIVQEKVLLDRTRT